MITVRFEPTVKPHMPLGGAQEGWELILWVGEVCDYAIPFRQILNEIVAMLSIESANLTLPAYFDGEECVEGQLEWEGAAVRIYYEYSLAYLCFMTFERAVLDRIAGRLQYQVQT